MLDPYNNKQFLNYLQRGVDAILKLFATWSGPYTVSRRVDRLVQL